MIPASPEVKKSLIPMKILTQESDVDVQSMHNSLRLIEDIRREELANNRRRDNGISTTPNRNV